MARKNKSTGKKVAIGIFGAVCVGLLIWGGIALQSSNTITPVVVETEATFLVYEQENPSIAADEDDWNLYLYKCDISEMTADEIEDLTFSDYSLADGTLSHEDHYTPDDDYMYYVKLNGTDIVEQWRVPTLGDNIFYRVNLTEDCAIVAYSTDELATTVNQTNYDKWTVQTQMLDAAEATGEAALYEGYSSYYDFEDDDDYSVVLRIEFNTTALGAWCDIKEINNVDVDDLDITESPIEHSSTVYTFYEIPGLFMDSNTFEFELSSALGTAFEIIGVSFGYGNADSYTAWDSQN